MAPVDLREAEILFRSRSFNVERRVAAGGGLESYHPGDGRDRLLVKADTLEAFVASHVAILFQRDAGLFTGMDVELRRTILRIYGWGWSKEPMLPTLVSQASLD